ncbi:MAG: hypothetical protein KF887_12650 [Paracoccaceae bacterium]|nr:MAG: hypothetical protein KF887_12650 [Paracoccaceae bacterium]
MFQRLFAAILTLALSAAVAPAQVSVYTQGGVKVMSNAQLGPNQRSGFGRFKSRAREFHGAFYISTGSDDASWWVDEHRLEDAKTSARRNCEAFQKAKGARCVLYAVILPAGAPKGQGKALPNVNATLSRELSRSMGKGGAGSWFAVAADRGGNWGVAWGHKTRDAARKDALLTCNKRLASKNYREQMAPAAFNEALSAGRFDCKLVREWQR